MKGADYCVMLFDSVSSTLLAEKILKGQEIPHKVIPVPRHISSDCGVCIRFSLDLRNRVEPALAGKVEFREICAL
ncbi:MAG TPA: DUF3343 domain-containing protein [Deltaproteobacteria bacterium]|jgi:hypothetical protein|nr:DUF3343 domain-containing protein [Deltaproteobacteria bacterium]MDI9542076.1 DUF3343 domain-containing protein [Pseudomonadota bacterium]HNU75117.1 DUF3343 domain-containing protein [Deltaproteobacteria bacterium]HOD71811.1 DUF3343 domain-containing protein [Deltaproteobacteria bacterium]HON61962.1 DUF3343 domain-containing protein [Deltaproteobacteria bacterium]